VTLTFSWLQVDKATDPGVEGEPVKDAAKVSGFHFINLHNPSYNIKERLNWDHEAC